MATVENLPATPVHKILSNIHVSVWVGIAIFVANAAWHFGEFTKDDPEIKFLHALQANSLADSNLKGWEARQRIDLREGISEPYVPSRIEQAKKLMRRSNEMLDAIEPLDH